MSSKGRKNKPTNLGRGVNISEGENDAELFRKFLEEDSFPTDKMPESNLTPSSDTSKKKKRQSKSVSIDLHGLTVVDAQSSLEQFINGLIGQKGTEPAISIRIITGKGLHSLGGQGILVREIYDFVHKKWSSRIQRIDSPPAQDLIEGKPFRGHFDLTLRLR